MESTPTSTPSRKAVAGILHANWLSNASLDTIVANGANLIAGDYINTLFMSKAKFIAEDMLLGILYGIIR